VRRDKQKRASRREGGIVSRLVIGNGMHREMGEETQGTKGRKENSKIAAEDDASEERLHARFALVLGSRRIPSLYLHPLLSHPRAEPVRRFTRTANAGIPPITEVL